MVFSLSWRAGCSDTSQEKSLLYRLKILSNDIRPDNRVCTLKKRTAFQIRQFIIMSNFEIIILLLLCKLESIVFLLSWIDIK